MTTLAAVLAGAYLFGSVPFSFLVARRFGVRDVRRAGSGNVGATNVMRVAGKTAGALAFLLDSSKGAAAALLAQAFEPTGALAPWAAVAAVVGHVYPVWLRFRGGKGVATGAGALLPLAPLPTLAALLLFGLTLALFRYVSVASIASSLALAAALFALPVPRATAWAAAAVAALIVWRHRENLARLRDGSERRLGTPTEAQLAAAAREERS
jgi:glycerol-3-phosphate acyltransferase PlsY